METLQETDTGLPDDLSANMALLNAWENGESVGLTPDMLVSILNLQRVLVTHREAVAAGTIPQTTELIAV